MDQPGGEWEKVVTAASDIEAHLIGGHLEDEGVEVLLEPDRTGYGDYLLGGQNPHAPVHIFVRAQHLDRARAIIAQIDDEETFVDLDGQEQVWDEEDASAPLAAPVRRPYLRALIALAVLGAVGALLYRDLGNLLDM